MATSFDRWEKDPFFTAAEEVQQSADRMESVYRRWIQKRKGVPGAAGAAESAPAELRRELHTVLGTAKWQLEELVHAVRMNDEALSSGKDTRARHDQFFAAIRSRIIEVEGSLKESNLEAGDNALTWVRLDEGERDELALFLSGPFQEREKPIIPSSSKTAMENNTARAGKEASPEWSKNPSHSMELRDDSGHHRAASASTDIGSWKILTPSEGEDTSERSSDDRPTIHLSKIHSFSVLGGALESKSSMKWNRNGFRKWKGGYVHDVEEAIPLRNAQSCQAIDTCSERSKSCLSTCREESYDKKIYGWLGAHHRQLQRSHYQIQYGGPFQIILSAILIVLLIFIFVLRSW